MRSQNFIENELLKELIEQLDQDTVIFSQEQSKKINTLFKASYPLTHWGKIDWEKVNNKVFLGHDPFDIILLSEVLAPHINQNPVYVEWSEASNPVIQANLLDLVENFDKFTRVDYEKFIFNPFLGYIVEVRITEITMGVVDVPHDLRDQWKNLLQDSKDF